MSGKLTKAQREWLRRHDSRGGTLKKWTGDMGSMTYVMAGKLSDLGLITIQDGERIGWPYGWESTTITDAGREALKAAQ